MSRTEVIEKVQKLFSLAHSANEHEAALAAAKARELLAKHNLTITDISVRNNDELRVTEESVVAGKVARQWQHTLFNSVSKAFDCECFYDRRISWADDYTRYTRFHFVGTETDVQVAVYTYRFLERELQRMVEEALPSLRHAAPHRNSFSLKLDYLEGATARIRSDLTKRTAAIKTQERGQCTDLLVLKDQHLKAYMDAHYPNLRRVSSQPRGQSASAFKRGYSDAANVNIRPGVHRGSNQRQIRDRKP